MFQVSAWLRPSPQIPLALRATLSFSYTIPTHRMLSLPAVEIPSVGDFPHLLGAPRPSN